MNKVSVIDNNKGSTSDIPELNNQQPTTFKMTYPVSRAEIIHTGYSWNILPQELRCLILETIIDESRDLRLEACQPQHGGASIGHLASVCRDWQPFFEKSTFRRIVLDVQDLPKFAEAMQGIKGARLNYIRRLWFRIKLAKYNCCSCTKQENGISVSRYVKPEFTLS